MSREAALAEARVLKSFMERHGVKCSIELVPGARTKVGWLNPPGTFRIEMSHHIVSRRSMGLTPFLSLVKKGRIDVKGPLCNGYGGFDEVYRIITMGVANHSGKGGPLRIDGAVIAKDQAAYFAWGTEYEGGLDPKDWSTSYRRFMAASNAAILDYLRSRNPRVSDDAHCEHSTWAPGRKSDRMGFTRERGIAEIREHRLRIGARPEPDPKPATEDDSDMRIISAPDRGVAVIGPGYFRSLRTDEEVIQARELGLPVRDGNNRQFDLWRAIATHGAVTGHDAIVDAIRSGAIDANTLLENLPDQVADELAERLVRR